MIDFCKRRNKKLLGDPDNRSLFDKQIKKLTRLKVIDEGGNYTQTAENLNKYGIDIAGISNLLALEKVTISSPETSSPETGIIQLEASSDDLINCRDGLKLLARIPVDYIIDGEKREEKTLGNLLISEYRRKINEVEPGIFEKVIEISGPEDKLVNASRRVVNGFPVYPRFFVIYEGDEKRIIMKWGTSDYYPAKDINFEEIAEYNSPSNAYNRKITEVNEFNISACELLGSKNIGYGHGTENNTGRLEEFLNLQQFTNSQLEESNQLKETLPRIYELDTAITQYYNHECTDCTDTNAILTLDPKKRTELDEDIEELRELKKNIREFEKKYYKECEQRLEALKNSQDIKLITDFYTEYNYEYGQFTSVYSRSNVNTQDDEDFKLINKNIGTLESSLSRYLNNNGSQEDILNQTSKMILDEVEKINNLIIIEKTKEKALKTFLASPKVQGIIAKINGSEDPNVSEDYILIKNGSEVVAVVSKFRGDIEPSRIQTWRERNISKKITPVTDPMNGMNFEILTVEELPAYKRINNPQPDEQDLPIIKDGGKEIFLIGIRMNQKNKPLK